MSQDQWTFIIILFGAVIVLGTAMITTAGVIRSKRLRAQRSGPGGADTPVPNDPWQRFGPALAAVYARVEWHDTRGARRVLAPEQTYFGYGCAMSLPMLRRSLARDWRVRKPEQAQQRARDAVNRAASDAVLLAGVRGETPEALSERLLALGAPRDVAEFLASRVPIDNESADRGAGMLPSLAFDLARFANLVRWSGSAGLLTQGEVREASDVLGAAAVTVFDGWNEFGEYYALALQNYTRRGNKPFLRAVEWLRVDPASPWRALSWPGQLWS